MGVYQVFFFCENLLDYFLIVFEQLLAVITVFKYKVLLIWYIVPKCFSFLQIDLSLR